MTNPLRFLPIPEQFFQEAERVPFSRCNVCDIEFDETTVYVIEKAFQTYQPYKSRDMVFEYAICMNCYESLSDSFSEESREAMSTYIESRVDLDERREMLMNDEDGSTEKWLSSCFISDKPVDELDGYQFVGVFMGDYMLVTHTPCLISAEVVGEIIDLMSNKTIDILGGFSKEIMPQPPGLDQDVPSPALVL